jgi:hypothetical protein
VHTFSEEMFVVAAVPLVPLVEIQRVNPEADSTKLLQSVKCELRKKYFAYRVEKKNYNSINLSNGHGHLFKLSDDTCKNVSLNRSPAGLAAAVDEEPSQLLLHVSDL